MGASNTLQHIPGICPHALLKHYDMLVSYQYPQFPSSSHIALYSTVANAAQLRSRIIKAATAVGDEGDREREAINFAFVDAKMV